MSTQRFLINGKKYCQHPVYSNYAAWKDGEIVNITTERILRMSENNCGYYKFFICDKKNLKNQNVTYSIDLFMKVWKD